MGKLEGKIAVITGGNGGIGFATAKQFVEEGAYVFITGRREPETAAAVTEIGSNVTGVQGDVSNLGDLDRLFAQIKREKGRLDIVFANAGVAKFAPLGEITEEVSVHGTKMTAVQSGLGRGTGTRRPLATVGHSGTPQLSGRGGPGEPWTRMNRDGPPHPL